MSVYQKGDRESPLKVSFLFVVKLKAFHFKVVRNSKLVSGKRNISFIRDIYFYQNEINLYTIDKTDSNVYYIFNRIEIELK